MKPFCLAPFTHSHIDVDGKNKLCCVARNELIEENLQKDTELPAEEFWNSSYMKDRREKMLSNNPPPECELCIHSNRVGAYKDHFNNHYEARLSELKNAETPVDLDIRIPVCNLKCRICNPAYSTSIANLYQKNRELLQNAGIYVPTENRDMRLRTGNSFNHFVKTGKIERVYFAGGEPTAVPDHLSQLQLLLNHNPQVHIGYNTNLSMKREFLEKWVLLLKKFQAVNVQCSLDGIHEIGEYIRDGLVFTQIDDNLAYLLNHRDQRLNVILDLTLTSLGLLEIVDFARYALSRNVFVSCKFMVGGPATHLRCEYLNPEQRKKIITEFNQFFSRLSAEEQKCLIHLHELINKLESLPEFSSSEKMEAAANILVYDKLFPDKAQFLNFFQSKDK